MHPPSPRRSSPPLLTSALLRWSAERHLRRCQPVHSGRRQLASTPLMVEGNSAAANADGAYLRRHGRLPHGLCQLHRPELRRRQPRPRAQDLLDQPQSTRSLAGAVLGPAPRVLRAAASLRIFTRPAEVVAAGMHRLCIMGFSYAISAFMDCTIAASRGLGR